MKKNLLIAALILPIAISGCQNVKRELGVGRNSPDEFLVVKRAPLSLPPEYTLRPPSTDSLPPASEVSDQARTAILGASSAPQKAAGSGEALILQKMGVPAANPDIRSVINQENGYIALENQTLTDKLIFWKEQDPAIEEKMPATVVNPKKETERLKKNEEEGKPVNEGDVPEIKPKQGTIDKIF
jgi:hypothetical protein